MSHASRFLVPSLGALALAGLFAAPAGAQVEVERLRFEAVSGVLMQGNLATTDFIADFSQFGGARIVRFDGTLDVDPSIWYGFRSTYRWNESLSFTGSWMHTRGRYRVQWPAEASIEGNFDLEGLLLSINDFAFGGGEIFRADRAMSDAVSDLYLATATWEFPVLDRWAYPYLSLGGGVFQQRSDGAVIQYGYESDIPAPLQYLNPGDYERSIGLSVFSLSGTNPVVSYGGGMRVSIGQKWGVDLQLEDVVRLGVDHSHVDATSTPEPDPLAQRLFSTTFRGTEGAVHNFGFRLSLTYAAWPFRGPR